MDTYTRRFIRMYCVLIFALIVSFYAGIGAMKWLFPIASWGGIIYLTAGARKLSARKNCNLSAAANVVQGYGIFSLISGIGVSLYLLGRESGATGITDVPFSQIAATFMEGCVSMGLGITLSVYLNYIGADDNNSAGVSATVQAGIAGGANNVNTGLATLANELSGINNQMQAVRKSVGELNGQLCDVTRDIGKFRELMDEVGKLVKSLDAFFPSRRGP